MSHAKNKIQWCLNKAQKELQEGKKHRGLVQIEPNKIKAKEHVEKAEHNLKATLYFNEGGYTDWCSSSLFYTIYHCFLAIITNFGYESRNQECTLALIASFIEDKKIPIEKEDLKRISSFDSLESQEDSTALNIREKYQYSTRVSLENKENVINNIVIYFNKPFIFTLNFFTL